MEQAEIDAGRGRDGVLTSDERAELVQLWREVRTLRMERDIPKKRQPDSLLRQGAGMKFAFIAREKATFPIDLLCTVLGVSRAGFYAAQRRPVTSLRREDQQLAAAANRARAAHAPRRPRVRDDLQVRGAAARGSGWDALRGTRSSSA